MPLDCCYSVDKAAAAGAAPALKKFCSILHCPAVFTQNLGQTRNFRFDLPVFRSALGSILPRSSRGHKSAKNRRKLRLEPPAFVVSLFEFCLGYDAALEVDFHVVVVYQDLLYQALYQQAVFFQPVRLQNFAECLQLVLHIFVSVAGRLQGFLVCLQLVDLRDEGFQLLAVFFHRDFAVLALLLELEDAFLDFRDVFFHGLQAMACVGPKGWCRRCRGRRRSLPFPILGYCG